MNAVRVLYCRTLSPREPLSYISTPLLRLGAWSAWSHEALVMEDGQTVIDATFTHGGVVQRPLADVLDTASKFDYRDIACPNPDGAYAFARSQLGKPYDVMGAIGLGLHRDWQRDDAWWCSEFVEAAIAAAGRVRFVNYPRRVTQQHSWMVA